MTPWNRTNDPWRDMSSLLRNFDRVFDDMESERVAAHASTPRSRVEDDGTRYRAVFDLPGFREEDLRIEATGDGLVVSGVRKLVNPEGATARRRERSDLRFSRSLAFPGPVELEQTSATLQDGVLTISVAKREPARARTITVKRG